ncbi:hypothetical protein [Pseudolactococcus raffinolactis]|uniref:hypothetical protein n=1 Tax=Pseudolactococcus raffinolactis TaxID=1366 RepID=UPI000BB51A90|nr:hypothetical protein [Lactococcus raffinolactis]ATC61780.1 hypothetical protein CMV25_07775 [Lactococcus raffinolactis]
MTLQGYQFDKAKVTPESDAQLYSYLAQSSDNKVISGLTVTATGLNVYVASGKALVQGRLVDNGQQMQLTAQANKTGYICITIDLTQDNTSTGTPGASNYAPVNNQLRLELVDTLNQQNLNSGGLIYTFPLYSYVSTGATLTLTKIKNSFADKVLHPYYRTIFNVADGDEAFKGYSDPNFLSFDFVGAKRLNVFINLYSKTIIAQIDFESPSRFNSVYKHATRVLVPDLEAAPASIGRLWSIEVVATEAIKQGKLRFGTLRYSEFSKTLGWLDSDATSMASTFIYKIIAEY